MTGCHQQPSPCVTTCLCLYAHREPTNSWSPPTPCLLYPHQLPEEVIGHACFQEIKGCSTRPRCRQKLASSILAYVTDSVPATEGEGEGEAEGWMVRAQR